ncbi:LpqN/LpqT family lipoprotein [Candidatus Mycolicibacterium alkanivorans]|uniref:LpqN/LpqT family lipoprotein n=1 Tax=Candidatus Mycolicibacterium alkanivorans TaxID=2954114 RepID=A0ABS9YUW6_9MYCO|nr:LpqN/LpqT family lipoprotein [Candidatus Mycolicibacterium alkanivorans]MCI4674662.1 LpqN/LpqT family lipoprotein [Candidatus Mycolicibacterium alkanivorans]
MVGAVGAAMVAVVTTATGCSGDQPAAAKCEEVSAPMTDIPTRTDQEPRLRIPQPQGWERTTKLDSETIRFALRNQGLTADGFTPNAVVTLQKVGADLGKPQAILDAQNQQLKTKLKVKDFNSAPAQVCGSPAQTSTYTAPGMGKIPARKATSVAVVYHAGDVNYVATVTVQTIKDNPAYAADSATIIKGFQMIPPK